LPVAPGRSVIDPHIQLIGARAREVRGLRKLRRGNVDLGVGGLRRPARRKVAIAAGIPERVGRQCSTIGIAGRKQVRGRNRPIG
jgi:hypothetical protein